MPDYVFTVSDELPRTATEQWEANMAAIRTVKEIEAEGRSATPEEQAILARYSGFGNSAFGQAFANRPTNQAWAKRGRELRSLVTPEEYESIRGSRLNAFYTTSDVINSMWSSLQDMGAGQLERPVVLEPSAGAGRFLGLQPPEMARKSQRIAVELDSLTGNIARHAYPDTQVHVAGYEQVHIPDNYVDIAISNVPFGPYTVTDEEYDRTPVEGASIHNYFFGKTIDKLKPGGVLAFITTHHTMDAPQARQLREHIAQQADFLGAVRLPKDTFPDTEVVTDIIYLRKREPGETRPVDRSWVETSMVELPTDYEPLNRYSNQLVGIKPQEYSVNQYFLDNPDKVLGIQDGTGTMRGPNQYNVRSQRGAEPLAGRVEEATEGIAQAAPRLRTREVSADPAVEVKLKRERDAERAARPAEGQYRVSGGVVERVSDGVWQPANVNKASEGRIRGMLGLRDEVRSLMEMEMAGDVEEEAVTRQRQAADQAYADFVAQHGKLNTRQNIAAMAGDPDAHFLRGLEVFRDEDWQQADVFKRRAFSPVAEYTATSPTEAMDVSLNVKGRVDVDYIAEMVGLPKNQVVQQLASEELIYLNPETRQFEPRSQYLSGTVAEKLAFAREAAEQNPAYRANIQALEQVQPERVPIGDVYLSMSSSWLPEDLVNEGLAHVLAGGNQYHRELYRRDGQPAKLVAFSPETGTWGAAGGMIGRRSSLNSEWGTGEVPAHKVIEHAVSNRPIKVFVKDDEGNRVFSETESRAAQQKIDDLRSQFTQWALEDSQRASILEDRYNEMQNISIPREYASGHMTFPGMSAMWQSGKKKMLPHQREAAARIVQDGNVMLAHEVGFGKTASMVAGAMERKRLGLTQKPMFVLPNATAAQFAGDFREMYPNAKILFQEKIGPEDRKVFLDRVRNNDWDAVLVTYNQFESIPVTTGTLDQYQALMMDQLNAAEAAAKETGAEYQEKQIQLLKKKANTAFEKRRARLEAMFDKGAVPFERLGVDHVFVDEADNFKNLGFFTSLEDIKGLNPTTQSMRGWDMFMKTQLLQGRAGQITNNKGEALRGGVVFATGSSISNSLAEMWTMMRYLQMDELEKRGLDAFDAWAANYGRMENTIEVRASGQYKPTTRFSKFANQPELSALWQNVADIRVQSELPVMLERQPKMVDREGNPKRIDVQSPMTDTTRAYMQHVAQRATELNADTQRDNMLKLSGDARKASLDVRFAPMFGESMLPWPPEPGYKVEANPQGKIPQMVENVAEVYHRETPDRGTQLVFLDMGTPKPGSDKDSENTSKDGNEDDELEMNQEEQAQLTETYNMIRRGLEAKGVPANEIAFIHNYPKNDQKKRLQQQVNAGKVRVLLGSTNKLGVGVNVQERLAAIHHVDVPWRPRDVEQREGRIIRQGNQVYGPKIDENTGETIDKGRGVQIYKYVQQGSFDEFMWQAVEKKAAGIKAITKRHVTARETEDVDEFVLSAAEARALASGNPKAIELVTMETKLAGMKLDRSAFESQRSNAQAQIGTLTNRVEVLQKQMPNYERDAELAKKVLESDTFAASDDEGKAFEKRADAEADFKETLAKIPFDQEVPLGTYKGFKLLGRYKDIGYQVVLVSTATGQKYLSNRFDDPATANVLVRADNVINKMVVEAEERAEQLADARRSLTSYKAQMEKPYDQLPELLSLEKKVVELRREVQGIEDTSGEAQAAEFSREQLVREDIEQASEDDINDAKELVVRDVMDRMRTDRSYQMPTGDKFDALVSDKLQDIMLERKQQEAAGIDDHVDEELLEEVPDSIPEAQRAPAAAAIEEAFDIDADRVMEVIEDVQEPDLTPTEVGNVVERVADRIHEESVEDGAEGRVTVVSMADVDAMLMEEMKDESIEEGVIPQYADTDYNEDGDDESEPYIDVAVSVDTVTEETLADRIRNFGDTGYVDPDDYETLMDSGFDGDIAEADSLEDMEALQGRDYEESVQLPEPVPAEALTPAGWLENDLGEYTGGQYEPFYDDIDTDYVTPQGRESDARRASELEERRVANEQKAADFNAALADGGTVMVQTAGGALEIRPTSSTEDTPAFRVGSDGNLQVLARWQKGQPVYDTLLSYQAAVQGAAPAPEPGLKKGTNRSALIHVVTKGDYALLSDVQNQIEPQVIERALKAGVIIEGVNDAGEKVLVYAKRLTDRDRRKQAEIQQAIKAEESILENADQWNEASEALATIEGHTYIPVVSDEARERGVDREAIAAGIEAKYDKLWDPRKEAEPVPEAEEPYYYRETDVATGEVTTHVEAASPEEASEVLEDLGPSPADDAPSVTRVDIDVATGETEVTITEAPADDLDDEEAQVLEAVADGVVTPVEAEELKSEAGRILAEVAQDTPDSPAPRRAYDSSAEISARIRELCDDPDELQELLARARADASESAQETRMAEQNRGDGDGDGNTVTESAASAAADVLAQARENTPDKPRTEPNKVRKTDLELLQAVMDDCDTEDISGPVRLELASFLEEKGGTPVDITADLSAVAVAEKPAGGKKGGKTPKTNPTPSASTKTKARARQRHPFLRGKEARK